MMPVPTLARFLMPYLRRDHSLVWGVCFFVVVAAAAILVFGFGLRLLIENGLTPHSGEIVTESLVILSCAVGGLALAAYWRTQLAAILGDRVMVALREKLYAHLISLDAPFVDQQKIGDLLNVLNGDITLIRGGIATDAPMIVRSILQWLGAAVLMVITAPILSLWAFTLIPIILSPMIVWIRQLKKESLNLLTATSRIHVHLEQSLSARWTIQAFGQEHHQQDILNTHHRHMNGIARKRYALRSRIIAFVMIGVFSGLSCIVMIAWGQVQDGTLSGGALASFLFYATVAAGSLNAMSEPLTNLQQGTAALSRIMGLLTMGSEGQGTHGAHGAQARPINSPPLITFQGVTFAYPSMPTKKVLQDLSFTIHPGERIAIVGPSGAGKSTILNLLLGFYAPQSGRITFDGVDIGSLSRSALRTHMAVVAQDPPIFHGSLRDNILFARPDASENALEHVLDMAQLKDFVRTLPRGLETEVGERGLRLSGGQKQRIAIARALLRGGSILLLDEATNALDSATETQTLDALNALMAARTSITIAHRLSTVQTADRIVVLEDGHIVGIGTHDTLMAEEGLYRTLASKQFFGHNGAAPEKRRNVP